MANFSRLYSKLTISHLFYCFIFKAIKQIKKFISIFLVFLSFIVPIISAGSSKIPNRQQDKRADDQNPQPAEKRKNNQR
jgi:hypothetical protein